MYPRTTSSSSSSIKAWQKFSTASSSCVSSSLSPRCLDVIKKVLDWRSDYSSCGRSTVTLSPWLRAEWLHTMRGDFSQWKMRGSHCCGSGSPAGFLDRVVCLRWGVRRFLSVWVLLWEHSWDGANSSLPGQGKQQHGSSKTWHYGSASACSLGLLTPLTLPTLDQHSLKYFLKKREQWQFQGATRVFLNHVLKFPFPKYRSSSLPCHTSATNHHFPSKPVKTSTNSSGVPRFKTW